MTDFSWPIRVYYEDTDMDGIVNHANYLKYLERARTEMLRKMGYELDTLARKREIIFAVRKITIKYLKPAYFNELINVNVRIKAARNASILFHQTILDGSKTVLCDAEVMIACLNKNTMKTTPIPEDIFTEFTA